MATTIGIDIGYQTVKIVSLSSAGRRWRLNAMGIGPCPEDSWKPEKLDNIDEIAKAIRDTMRQAKPHPIKGKTAAIALPESVIFSGTFSAPLMSSAELKHALPVLIGEKLSLENINDYYIDYEEITGRCDPITHEDAKKKDAEPPKDKKATPPDPELNSDEDSLTIFAVAAKKSLVDSLVELLAKAGLGVGGIDIKPGAIARAVIDKDDNLPRLIIDVGVGGTGASIVEGKILRVTSIIPWGTNVIGKEITGPVDDLKKKAAPVFDELIHITKFFENRVCPGMKISEIIISGSGANIANLQDTFKQETGLPVRLANPFAKIDTHRFPIPESMTHTFSDAIGLAMRKN